MAVWVWLQEEGLNEAYHLTGLSYPKDPSLVISGPGRINTTNVSGSDQLRAAQGAVNSGV